MRDYGAPPSEAKEGMKIALVVVLALLLLGLIAAGIWFFRVAVAQPKGEGDAHIQKYSAENWVEAQARFEDMYAEVVATDQKIQVAKERLDANPDDRTAEDTYYGTKTICLSFVGEYNAEARKYLAEDFRAADLPDQISTTDPTTDCQ